MLHSRIPPITPGTIPKLAEAEKKILATRGQISPLYQILLNSLPLTQGWESLLTVIRQKMSVDSTLRELIILRIALLNFAAYEFAAHLPHAIASGMSQQKIDALSVNADEPAFKNTFDAVEQLVLRYTDTMTKDIHVPDELFNALRPHFDATQLVELTATIAAYNMVSRFLVALDIREV